MRTLTSFCPDRRSAQSSAAAAGPTTSTWPADLNSTAGTGSASGSAASATSAAIFAIALPRSPRHPACSRRLTNCSFACEPALAASSLNSAASWVQATITSDSPSAAWKAAASRRQSWSWTCNGSFSLSAAASAFASRATLRLQLQTLSVLPSRLIGLVLFDLRLVLLFLGLLFFFLLVEQKHLRLVQRRQHFGRNRVGDVEVPGVRLEGIGDVEVGIVEQLLQRRAAQRILHLGLHERTEVGLGRELLDRRQRLWRLGFLLFDRRLRGLLRGVLMLQPGPATEEIFRHA